MSADEAYAPGRLVQGVTPPVSPSSFRSGLDLQEIRDKLSNAQHVFDDYRAARAVRQREAEFAWARIVQEAALALPHLAPAIDDDHVPWQPHAVGAPPKEVLRDAASHQPGPVAPEAQAALTVIPVHPEVASPYAERRSTQTPAEATVEQAAPIVRPYGPERERRVARQPDTSVRRSRPVLVIVLLAVAASVSAVGLARLKLGASSRGERAATVAGTAFEGTITPANQFTIAAPATTIVQRVIVSVGERVAAGQPLLVTDDRDARAALQAAELDLRTAESRVADVRRRLALLDQIPSADFALASGRLSTAQRASEQVPTRQWRDSPERAEAAHELARLRLERVQKLWEQGLIARQEFDDAAIGLRVAANDLENARRAAQAVVTLTTAQSEQSDLQWKVARAEQAQQRETQRAELSAALLRRDEATLQARTATDRLAGATITASSPGVVTEVLAHAGDQVYGGAPLVRLAVLDPLLVEVQVAPSLINALSPGQAATVTLPGAAPEQTPGIILAVNPIPNRNGNHTVQVRFENKAGQLLAGQPAEVRFVTP